jgi:hypothetical protein
VAKEDLDRLREKKDGKVMERKVKFRLHRILLIERHPCLSGWE